MAKAKKTRTAKYKREEEEEEKIEQPEMPEEPAAEPAPEPEPAITEPEQDDVSSSLEKAQARQADNVTLTQTEGGVKAASGPTNRPNDPGMFDLMSAKAYREADVKVVKAGALDQLPEILQDDEAALSEKNAKGELNPNASHNWSSEGNEINLDYSSIKDVKHGAYFSTNLLNDKQKEKFFKTLAKQFDMELDDLYYQVETLLGDKAFDMPHSAKGQLKYAGLYDLEGNELDLATANQAQVVQAIRMIPPGAEHDMAVKAYKKLYGWTTDEDLDFMDSADLTKTDYNAAVKAYNAAFTFSDGATDANTEAYLNGVEDIYNTYSNPRVQKQMIRQLANAYESHTGVIAPTVDEIRALEEQQEMDEPVETPNLADRLKTAWDGVTSLFSGKGKAKRRELTEEDIPEAAAAGQRDSGGGSSGGTASSYAAASGAQQTAEMAAMQGAMQEPAEVQGPAYQEQAEEQPAEEEPQTTESNAEKYANRIEYDPNMTDAQVYAQWRKGATLDQRNMDQIGWVTGNRNVQALFNGMGMYGDLGSDETGKRNVIDKFSYFGNSIGAASMVISNGSLPQDTADTAMLALGDVVNEIDRIVADPNSGISVPKGKNMYEYVLGLPEYSGLAAQVEAVSNAQVQANEAYAEQALLEEEARQAQLESDRKAILSGNGTPEMATRLAAEYGSEYVDLSDDEMRAVYRFQMSERSSFFSDNGTFWNGSSAAAMEGNNLRKLGQGYGAYKSSLKNETEKLIDEYTTAAIRMGVTLEDYLNGAGITDLSQIIDIAYSGMLESGNAYANDQQAQDAAAAIATTSVGMWDAAVMGAQHGAESYAADFSQTLYMAIDAADYNTAVLDLQNDYRTRYGDEQAARMYYADLMAYIDSGALSEESANDLLDHMARANSIFDVAYEIDPGFLEGLMRDTHEGLQKDVEALEAVASTLPENERWVFNGLSGIAYSIPGMAVSTVTGGVTGSALVGSVAGWGMTEYSSAYDANRAKGMSPGMAGFMALGNAAVTAATNIGGTGTQMDLIFGGSAYETFRKALMDKGGKGLVKAMGGELLKRGHEEGVEEVTELVLGNAYDLLDKEALALDSGAAPSLSRTLRNIGESLEEIDPASLGREILSSYGMGVAYGGIFSLVGVGRTALAARRGINAQNHYASIDLATQMADGNVPFTEDNIGKVYAAVQKDMEDPRYRRWIDSANMAAKEQNATMTAMLMGTGSTERKTAVAEAQKAQEYEAKAEAARSASQTAQSRWWELRDRLSGGDMSAEVELESARMQWQKAETALVEAENAAQKSKERASQSMSAWLKACRAMGTTAKSWELKRRADQIVTARMEAAQRLYELYEAERSERNKLTSELVHDYSGTEEQLGILQNAETANRQTAERVAAEDNASEYAEASVFGGETDAEIQEDNSDIDLMSDEELDAEIAEIAQAESEEQARIAEIESQREELGLTDEAAQEMTGEVSAATNARKERIIAREKSRFNNAFERMQQALEMDNEEAADQIQAEYDGIGERLRTLGVDTDSLIAQQYGISVTDADAAYEAAQQQEAKKAEEEKYGKLTDDLSRRMEATNASLENVAPARRYFAANEIYVNESQTADILAADGVKSIPQFNRKHHTKLTTKPETGAMPLDGHVLSDIASEAAGSVQTDADPVSELLRVVQDGKKYAAEQKAQNAEAKELAAKRKAADQRRRASVDALVSAKNAQASTTQTREEAAPVETSPAETAGSQATTVDAMAEGNTPATPAQAAQQLTKKGKKLEANALKAVQDLADSIGVGFRIKSDARFRSADARVGKNVLGYYKNGQRNAIVRSKEAGRLEISGHEIGHAVQEQLGMHSTQAMIDSWQRHFPDTGAYTPDQYDHEAFAEFFWRYLMGRDVAAAYADDVSVDAFEYALRKDKKLRKAVEKAQDQVSTYFNSSDTGARIQANIVTMADANKKTPFAERAKRTIAQIVDDTAALEPLQDVIRSRTDSKHLDYKLNLRDTIRYNRRATGRAEQCISTAMVDNDGNVIGESLTDVFSEIDGKDYDLYMQWWLARHSLDRDQRKTEEKKKAVEKAGGNPDKVSPVVDQVFAESDITTEERSKFIAETEFAHPEFAKTNERFQKWRRLFLETYLVDNGLMGKPSQASAMLDMLEQIYPYYAPTKRAGKGKNGASTTGGKNGQKSYAMREATGSTEQIIDPFESFVGMINSVVSLAAENENKRKFARLYDQFSGAEPGNPGAGMGLFANEITQDMQKNVVDVTGMRKQVEKILDEIDTDPEIIMQISDLIGDERTQYRGTGRVDMNNVIRVRDVLGEDRYFEIYNPEIYELLANTSGQSGKDDGVLKGLSKLTHMMSMLTTGSNPVFGITNALRDFQNSVNYGSWAKSYVDGAAKWLATLKDVVLNTDVSKEYDAMGGGGWTQYETKTRKGADRVKGEVFKGYNSKNIGQIGKTAGRILWRVATMEDVNGAIEKTSRLAEYKYGKHDRTTTEGKIEAFLAAQDVTTDFARRGNSKVAKDLKYLIPFFNASMQGVYRNARQFTAQESNMAKARLAKQITNTALASLLANGLMMMYLDDDEKEEFTYLSEDLTAKHMFIPNFAPDVFGDAMLIRIPLDQNPISYAVNAAVSNMVWKGETGDDFLIGMASLADLIGANLYPAGSTILDPMFSVMSNKNWYGSKIVPTYLETYDELNQYTEETPLPFVRGAELLNGVTGVKISPMMLQYLAEQYTGYVGQTLIPALPSEKNQNGLITGMWDALVATSRKRITSDPLKSNDVISEVYDSFNAMQAVSKAGRSNRDFDIDYLNPMLTERQMARAIDEAYKLTHSKGALYEAKKELGVLDDEIDEINAREDLTERQKYILTSELRREKVEIALDAQEVVNDYDARYKCEGILPRIFAKMLSD